MSGTRVTIGGRSQASDHPLPDRVGPLGHPPLFVGREHELRRLELAFEAAAGRQEGALIMLVGEPGIGKTAVCQQLARFVKAHGGLPLVSHCYEEGSFRVPYQPFVEALDSYLQDLDLHQLTAELGSEAADLSCSSRMGIPTH